MKRCIVPFLSICLMLVILSLGKVFFFQQVNAESDTSQKLGDAELKKQKILVLIIASDDQPVYLELQKIWRSYMHLDKEHVEAYFLKANPDLASTSEISGDIIWAKTPLGLYPGIIQTTLLSMETMLPRLKEFDYVVRTNLSSFYVFSRLFTFLDTLPKTKCYSAHIDGDPRFFVTTWGCGAGIILSPDLVEMLVSNKPALLNSNYINLANDDLIIAEFFRNRQIKLLSAPRTDILIKEIWEQRKDMIPSDAFHFRVKNPHVDLRLTDDIYVHKELLKMFYPQAAKLE
ncbi:MAG: hypothetical protein ACHQUC_06320 [Chlamydiales bacterium]